MYILTHEILECNTFSESFNEYVSKTMRDMHEIVLSQSIFVLDDR